jgi:hypothetical protein
VNREDESAATARELSETINLVAEVWGLDVATQPRLVAKCLAHVLAEVTAECGPSCGCSEGGLS